MEKSKTEDKLGGKFLQRGKGAALGLGRFFTESRNELRKVQWPNRKETVTYTTIVVVASLGLSLFIWVVDQGLGLILRWLVA